MKPRRAWCVLRHTRLSVCDADGNWRRAGQWEALRRAWQTDRERRKYLRAKHRAEAAAVKDRPVPTGAWTCPRCEAWEMNGEAHPVCAECGAPFDPPSAGRTAATPSPPTPVPEEAQ